MVLSNVNLHRDSYKSTSIKPVDENRSIFVDSLEMLKESDRFINDIMKSIHMKVLLSEASDKNSVYLQEFSFKDIISDIIGLFVDLIKSIYNKFKSLMQKIIGSDKTIEKYETKLRNMKGVFNVTFERYIYTCSDGDIPNVDLKMVFYDDYDILIGKLKEISDLKTKTERCEKMRSLQADVSSGINQAYYDSVRQRTIRTTHMISKEYYAEELFNVFRDGGNRATTKIDSTEINNILNRYLKHKDILKETENKKNDTIRSAKEVEGMIKRISLQKNNKYYVPYDTEEEFLFNEILQRKIGQINEICNIFVLAYSAKLDAIKESAIQDKKVLFEAIKFINMGEV